MTRSKTEEAGVRPVGWIGEDKVCRMANAELVAWCRARGLETPLGKRLGELLGDHAALASLDAGASEVTVEHTARGETHHVTLTRVEGEGAAGYVLSVRERPVADEILRVVGHDLRNPLQVVRLSVNLLRAGAVPDAARQQVLSRIDAAARQSDLLTRELVDYVRLATGGEQLQPEASDLGALVREAADEVKAASPGRQVQVEADGPVPGEWDVGRLGQALEALVRNAVQHGDVDEPVTVRLRAAEGRASVEVHNGGEIPGSLVPILFDPSARLRGQRQTRSAGLGLYLAREAARAHGGELEFETDAARGTTFRLSLPLQN